MKNFKERYPDIKMHMMLIPNAANVMEDKLPAFAVTANQSRQISRVKAELGDSYDWIDAEKVLVLTRMKQFIITQIITGLLLVHGMHSREQRRSLDWIRVKKLR